jgi:gamma-glutamyltranspeptidase / glutathione hydrolase
LLFDSICELFDKLESGIILPKTLQLNSMKKTKNKKRFLSKKRLFIILLPLELLLVFVILDIIIARNIYHPLTHVYKTASWLICNNSFVENNCDRSSSIENTTASNRGVVVTSHKKATQIGIDILQQGGNAIDAAVAVGYALAVVDPCCGNIGGGGFMVIRLATGEKIFINFRETAPQKATVNMYEENPDSSRQGYLAVGIPGTVKGLDFALNKYGTMSRQKVMQGSIDLAQKGFILESGDIKLFKSTDKLDNEDREIAKIFTNESKSYRVGDRLIQSDLARTLKKISLKGETAFYQKDIADSIVSASEKSGGILTKQDFINYRIEERKPLICKYREYEIITSPPPGGGVTLCQMLNVLEGFVPTTEEATKIHRRLATMLFAYRDRNKYLGDPNFVSIPLDRLLSEEYATQIRESITDKAAKNDDRDPTLKQSEGTNTTHYSIVDRWGNAVSVTYTINSYFGAGVVPEGTGIILNNQMDDFTTRLGKPNQFGLIQGNFNRIEPKKRPLSSMTPTIVTKSGKVVLVTGSPGGSTIPTTVLQVIVRFIDEKKSLSDAVNEPKIHYQGQPNLVVTEPYALDNKTYLELWEKGYRVMPFINWGGAESIGKISENEKFIGINDRRKSGSAEKP